VAHAVLRDWVTLKSGRPSAAPPSPAVPPTLAAAARHPGAEPGHTG
jgi:hypothetical protein